VSRLADVAAAADPALAPYAVGEPPAGRFEHVDGVRGFVLEAVYEGYLLHYGEPRAFAGMDRDMRLLAGDAILSDLISATAQAQAEGRPEDAEALWDASAASLAAAPR
jgi:hypothetical protein